MGLLKGKGRKRDIDTANRRLQREKGLIPVRGGETRGQCGGKGVKKGGIVAEPNRKSGKKVVKGRVFFFGGGMFFGGSEKNGERKGNNHKDKKDPPAGQEKFGAEKTETSGSDRS